jgi:hypothetical protein
MAVSDLRRLLVPAALALSIAAAASCENMPLTAPSGSTITLIPTANSLAPDGEMEIIALVLEGQFSGDDNGPSTTGAGTPVHNGTVVNFATTLGRVEPARAETRDGRATVRLIADGRTGTAVVTAYSGPAITTLDVVIGSTSAAGSGR